jgi:ABC-type uncharacterized transport system involved in gliding motility auxiliary subunit
MNSSLFFIPFLAAFVGLVGTAIGGGAQESKWVGHLALGIAASLFVLWIALDISNFKRFFSRKGAKYGAGSGIVVVLGLGIIIGLAVLTSRPRFNKTFDVTRDQLNTLSEQSIKVAETIRDTKATIKITAYFSDENIEQTFRDLLFMYEARGSSFSVEYLNPQKEPTKAIADKITDLNTVIVRRESLETRLSTFSEEKLTNAFVNVLKDKTKKIYFTKGHGEGALRSEESTGFNFIVQELENTKIVVEDLSLLEAAKVPDDADAVIIAGPKYDLKEEETRILEDYLKRGGAVLTMVNGITPVETLNKMLEKFGLAYNSDFLILDPASQQAQMYTQNYTIVSGFDEFHPISRDFASQSQIALPMRSARTIREITENTFQMKITLAGKTFDQQVRIKDVFGAADLTEVKRDRLEAGAFPVIAVASGKIPGPSTANNEQNPESVKTDAVSDAGATKSPETRLIVMGSVEFANNANIASAEQRDMFLNMTNYLLQDEDFISIRPKDQSKSELDMKSPISQVVFLLVVFVYPFFFLGSGTLYWLRRRRA